MKLDNNTLPKFTAEAALGSENTLENPVNHIRVCTNFQTMGENITLAIPPCPPCGKCGADRPGYKECFQWLPGPQECISKYVRCGTTLNCCNKPLGSSCP